MDTVELVQITEDILDSSTVEEPETLWSSVTTYGDGAEVYRVVSGVHQGFVSAQPGNTNHVPETDTDFVWWIPTGPTNRWAALDQAANTYAERADSLEYVLQLPAYERADTLYLSGLTGLTVEVVVEDPIDGVVVDESYSLSSTAGILDEFDWSFAAIVRESEILIRDLTRGAGSKITIRVLNEGGTARLGNIALGVAEPMGGTRWGANVSSRDYSVEQENDFGEELTVQRGFRKLANLTVLVENRLFSYVVAKLNGMRARQHLYIGDDRFAPLVILGRYEEYALEMSLPPDLSVLSLRLKSLVQE